MYTCVFISYIEIDYSKLEYNNTLKCSIGVFNSVN